MKANDILPASEIFRKIYGEFAVEKSEAHDVLCENGINLLEIGITVRRKTIRAASGALTLIPRPFFFQTPYQLVYVCMEKSL